jgi:hypothetical protein
MQNLDSRDVPQRPIVTPRKAADLLGVTISRVSALCRANKISHFLIGRVKYPFLDAVLEYKQSEERVKYAPKRGEKMPTYMKLKTLDL